MKHYFKLFHDKLLCKHLKWKEIHRKYDGELAIVGYTYACSECGKIKKISV